MSEHPSLSNSIDPDKFRRFKALLADARRRGKITEQEEATLLSILSKVEMGSELSQEEAEGYNTIHKRIVEMPNTKEVKEGMENARRIIFENIPRT